MKNSHDEEDDMPRGKGGVQPRSLLGMRRCRLTLPLQEVFEFADYLGMDVDQDQEFLWIAVEAMFAPLANKLTRI